MMYLLNELIFLSPLIIYAYVSLRKLISPRRSKNLFTIFFALLVAAYPAAEALSHGTGGGPARYAILAGYYSLPTLLYLVLTVILSGLLIGALRLIRALSPEVLRSPGFRAWRLRASLAVPALVVIAGIANYRHLQVKEYSVEVPRQASRLDRLKIVFASDFHLGGITADHFLEDFVTEVNALEPDIVLIGGDVLEGDRRDEDTGPYEILFRRIKARYGVYGVPGNHEGHGGPKGDFFEKAGIRMLADRVEKIDEAFLLAGRNDAHSGNRKSVADLLRNTPQGWPVILLDHRPTDLESAGRSGVDIQLSGHTHHGQLFPINWITGRQYELSWGYKKKGRTHIFVSSGVQLWGPPVRTVGASEILVVDVVFRENL
jgi:predicted MPP superfamily phosphohydrolase